MIDANLGGGVIKQRIARSGQGKSGGSRSIILFRKDDCAVYVYGFEKKDLGNIQPSELEAFRALANVVLGYSAAEMKGRVEDGALFKSGRGRRRNMPKRYRSAAMAAIHETASDLHKVGGMDKKTMREFDVLCLTPIQDMTPRKIRALRNREKTSQTVFAAYLNVTPSLVSKWERGEKRPQGASLKLLSLVDRKGLKIVA